jgi:predicted  nucleic acid-binding Zn-ribbon protein
MCRDQHSFVQWCEERELVQGIKAEAAQFRNRVEQLQTEKDDVSGRIKACKSQSQALCASGRDLEGAALGRRVSADQLLLDSLEHDMSEATHRQAEAEHAQQVCRSNITPIQGL